METKRPKRKPSKKTRFEQELLRLLGKRLTEGDNFTKFKNLLEWSQAGDEITLTYVARFDAKDTQRLKKLL